MSTPAQFAAMLRQEPVGEWSYDEENYWLVFTEREGASAIIAFDVQPQWAERLLATLDAERAARAEPGKDATIERLTQALRVASHSPHDQAGEPVEGFPVCSVCGAIQTGAARAEPGLRAMASDLADVVRRAPDAVCDLSGARHADLVERRVILAALEAHGEPQEGER